MAPLSDAIQNQSRFDPSNFRIRGVDEHWDCLTRLYGKRTAQVMKHRYVGTVGFAPTKEDDNMDQVTESIDELIRNRGMLPRIDWVSD